jgi:hypothetical protein
MQASFACIFYCLFSLQMIESILKQLFFGQEKNQLCCDKYVKIEKIVVHKGSANFML